MVTKRLLKDYKSVRKIGIGRSDRVLLRHVSGINNLSDKGFSAEVHDAGILPAYRRNYHGGGVSKLCQRRESDEARAEPLAAEARD